MVVDTLDGIVLEQQLDGRLGPNARDAGDVVGRVSAERLQVDDLVGRKAAVTLTDLGHAVEGLLLRRVLQQYADTWPNKLQRVGVAGDDDRVYVFVAGLSR